MLFVCVRLKHYNHAVGLIIKTDKQFKSFISLALSYLIPKIHED